MIKLIATIVVAIAIIGGAYWLSGIKKDSAVPTPTQTQGTTPSPTTSDSVTKGPFGIRTGTSGEYLTDKDGMTLYVKIADENPSGKITSSCNATCEKTWIPYLLGDNEAAPEKSSDPLLVKLNLFKRSDNKIQFALGTTLLYRYAGDQKVGDTSGTSVSGWAVARP